MNNEIEPHLRTPAQWRKICQKLKEQEKERKKKLVKVIHHPEHILYSAWDEYIYR